MNKILMSTSMIGKFLNESLEYNLDLLCAEFDVDLTEVMQELAKSTSRDEINDYLDSRFPNQLKVVD
jgi:hypothetical protein